MAGKSASSVAFSIGQAAKSQNEANLLQSQIISLPSVLKEKWTADYYSNQSERLKESQEFQFTMMFKLGRRLLSHRIELGPNVKKSKLQDIKQRAYTIFFRVEPGKYMSKPQFLTAMNRAFTEPVIKVSLLYKLFDSFDEAGKDRLDWRLFIYLLVICVQPDLPILGHICTGFSIFVSIGSLESHFSDTDSLALSSVKDILCIPVVLSKRFEVRRFVDDFWQKLGTTDTSVAQAMARNSSLDPDNDRLNYNNFLKLLTRSDFALWLKKASHYSVVDSRSWTYLFEETYYHSIVIEMVRSMRWDVRAEVVIEEMRRKRDPRLQRTHLDLWKLFLKRRRRLRDLLVTFEVTWVSTCCGGYFDHWKRFAVASVHCMVIQRTARREIAKIRCKFLRDLKRKVTTIQAGVRQIGTRNHYRAHLAKRMWAATLIQRNLRGFWARRRVLRIVEAQYDTGKRLLELELATWTKHKENVAARIVQCFVKRFLVRRHVVRRRLERIRVEQVKQDIEVMQGKAEAARQVHRIELNKWFIERKKIYDQERFVEERTADQRSKMAKLRTNNVMQEMRAKEQRQQQIAENLEDQKVTHFLKKWEDERARRGEEMRTKCNRALEHPLTPEERTLADVLKKMTKQHLKVVLRRADQLRVPMEIPEGMDLALLEVIQMQVESAYQKSDEDQKKEAEEIVANKAEDEDKLRRRDLAQRRVKMFRAATKIQTLCRVFIARRELRRRAYKGFRKHFDPKSLNYYYENCRTGQTSWGKPKCLGLYDIDADPDWVVISDIIPGADDSDEAEIYFYCPKTWEMTWNQPIGTILCEKCGRDFAVAFLLAAKQKLCGLCFYNEAYNLIEPLDDNIVPMAAEDVVFKSFKGNKEGAGSITFDFLKEENFRHYLTSHDKMVEKILGRTNDLAAANQNLEGGRRPTCSRCEDAIADVTCHHCVVDFCDSCFQASHSKEPWNSHPITQLADLLRAKNKKARLLEENTKKINKKKAKKAKRLLKKQQEAQAKAREEAAALEAEALGGDLVLVAEQSHEK